MKVSIITAYYKGREYLSDYIKMIMRNVKHLGKAGVLEVIIVNDYPAEALSVGDVRDIACKVLSDKCVCSIDKDILRIAYNGNEVAIKILVNEHNMGIHASRVNGLKASSGEYVIFLDQDDILSKDAVATYMGNVHSAPEVLVANAVSQRCDTDLSGCHSVTYLKWFRTMYQTKLIGDLDTYVNVGTQIISPGHCLIYKEAIPKEWKEYMCTNNGADDYFLWLLMLAKGVEFRYVDKCLYLHRFTEKNLSEDTSVTDVSTMEFATYLEEIEYFPDEYVDRLRRMVEYKARFRGSTYSGKIASSISNLELLVPNVVHKVKTRTPLGFNR